ncbi:hypothetical protein RB195_016404 [Necator americanus]|uniref:Uncharacterized protein n=1 Tax=Necator americanus TaxID=51031 RepID=A0ABR1E912_NECAM
MALIAPSSCKIAGFPKPGQSRNNGGVEEMGTKLDVLGLLYSIFDVCYPTCSFPPVSSSITNLIWFHTFLMELHQRSGQLEKNCRSLESNQGKTGTKMIMENLAIIHSTEMFVRLTQIPTNNPVSGEPQN